MALFGGGSASKGVTCATNVAISANNCTFSVWGKAANWSTTTSALFYAGTWGSGVYSGTWYFNTGSGSSTANAAITPANNTWHNFIGVVRDGTRELWLDGVQLTGIGLVAVPAAQNATDMELLYELSSGGNWALATTLAAEAAMWPSTALSPAEIAQIARGANPLAVHPNGLFSYLPARGDLIDLGSNRRGYIANNGYAPSYGDHPPVALPPRRRLLKAATAGGGSVGTATGSGAASGVGASTAAAAGSSSGAGAASGVGAALFSSVGTSAGAGTATGVSGAAGVAVGAAAGAGTAAGVGASQAAAVASAAGAGSAAGVARALFSAIATAAGSSTASGVSPGGAVGSASGSATVSGVGASRAAAVGTAAGLATVAGIAAGGTARRPLIFVVT